MPQAELERKASQEIATDNLEQYKKLGGSLIGAAAIAGVTFAVDMTPAGEFWLCEAALLVLLCLGFGRFGQEENGVTKQWRTRYSCLGVFALVFMVTLMPWYFGGCWGHASGISASDYAAAYTFSGCTDPTHCGTFVRTSSTCDCGAPVYQLPSADGDGAVLYRTTGPPDPLDNNAPEEGTRWNVGPGEFGNCRIEYSDSQDPSDIFLRSGLVADPGVPSSRDERPFNAFPWRRHSCKFTDDNPGGECRSVTDDITIVASDGTDLCTGVDCGTGERKRFSHWHRQTLASAS